MFHKLSARARRGAFLFVFFIGLMGRVLRGAQTSLTGASGWTEACGLVGMPLAPGSRRPELFP